MLENKQSLNPEEMEMVNGGEIPLLQLKSSQAMSSKGVPVLPVVIGK